MRRKTRRITEADIHRIANNVVNENFNRRINRIVNESITKVLNEGLKGSDPKNAVPEDLAAELGFSMQYDCGDGYELWGKRINPGSEKKILSRLGISRFTNWNENGSVLITVSPSEEPNSVRGFNPFGSKKKIGDYVSTEYGDSNGEIFHNPKNGHFKRF